MQRAGEHHALALQTPPKTEHYVARNLKNNSIEVPSKNLAGGGLGRTEDKDLELSKVRFVRLQIT